MDKMIDRMSKHMKTEPEDIQSKLNSRSGIRELKKEMSENSFEAITKQKVRSILQAGRKEVKFTGKELFEILNQEKNAEILSEILGKQEVDTMRSIAKSIGKKEISRSSLQKAFIAVAGHAVKGSLYYKVATTIFPIIISTL